MEEPIPWADEEARALIGVPLPKNLRGPHALFCRVCRVWTPSLTSYEDHASGKKHLNAVAEAALQRAEPVIPFSKALSEAEASVYIRQEGLSYDDVAWEAAAAERETLIREALDEALNAVNVDGGSGEEGKMEQDLDLGVLLYYKYADIPSILLTPLYVWHYRLCTSLDLSGRIRIAVEGINGTVGGSPCALRLYMFALEHHPLFRMEKGDWKTGPGGKHSFSGLQLWVTKEIVSLGLDPKEVHFKDTGVHLSPKVRFCLAIGKRVAPSTCSLSLSLSVSPSFFLFPFLSCLLYLSPFPAPLHLTQPLTCLDHPSLTPTLSHSSRTRCFFFSLSPSLKGISRGTFVPRRAGGIDRLP